MKVLFVLKKNEVYSFQHYCRRSSGLWNSVKFIRHALSHLGHREAEQIEVTDNNDIDRAVSKFKPDIVIIEALWVVPEKFDELKSLHPDIDWYVHLHSDIPFLAVEGIAMEWIKGYRKRGVGIIANSQNSFDAIEPLYA